MSAFDRSVADNGASHGGEGGQYGAQGCSNLCSISLDPSSLLVGVCFRNIRAVVLLDPLSLTGPHGHHGRSVAHGRAL